MLRIRNPSLELNWLPNSVRKGMPTPRMAIVDGADYGGAYWRKTKDRCVLDGLGVDLKEGGFIALGTIRNAGCIAHEYRHPLADSERISVRRLCLAPESW